MAKASLGRYAKMDEELSLVIKSKRIRRGLGVDYVAKYANVSRSSFFKHLKKPSSITIGELRAYIRVLDIPKEDVIAALYEGGE